jgi:hypothetical protein
MSSPEDHLSTGQKVSFALFLLLVIIGSLEVAWHRMLYFPPAALYAAAVVMGVITALFWVRRRYLLAGILGGIVAGLTSVWFTIFVLESTDSAQKLVVVFTAFLGTLPGIAVLLGVKWAQDRLFPPVRRPGVPSAPEGPPPSGAEG